MATAGLKGDKSSTNPSDALEREKINLERRKLEVELQKARWTAIATIVPLVVAFMTLGVTVTQLRQQSQQHLDQIRLQTDMQERAANAQFRLKAAELVVNNADPQMAYEKAQVLQALFPENLSSTWPTKFKPDAFMTSGLDDRINFALRAADHPQQRKLLADLWITIFAKEPSYARALLRAGTEAVSNPVR
jgi:hypothetical protein